MSKSYQWIILSTSKIRKKILSRRKRINYPTRSFSGKSYVPPFLSGDYESHSPNLVLTYLTSEGLNTSFCQGSFLLRKADVQCGMSEKKANGFCSFSLKRLGERPFSAFIAMPVGLLYIPASSYITFTFCFSTEATYLSGARSFPRAYQRSNNDKQH